MQVIYNVTVSVNVPESEDWLKWMREEHIPEMMNTNQFLEARISRVIGEEDGGKTYAIQYLCKNQATYDNYQKEFAPRLQADHMKRFGKVTAAFRTLLQVYETFEK